MWEAMHNLVRGRRGRVNNPTPAYNPHLTEKIKWSINPIQLLNPGISDYELTKSEHVILDGYQRFPIDEGYRDLGIKEGWLIKTGFYPEGDKLIWTYVLKE